MPLLPISAAFPVPWGRSGNHVSGGLLGTPHPCRMIAVPQDFSEIPLWPGLAWPGRTKVSFQFHFKAKRT